MKRFLPWLPYILVIGVLYFLGYIRFQSLHPIVFMLIAMPIVAAGFVVAMRSVLKE